MVKELEFVHGTIPGHNGKYRLNTNTNKCEFVLWEPGEQGHSKPFWHVMGLGWVQNFKKGYPTEQQKAERLEF